MLIKSLNLLSFQAFVTITVSRLYISDLKRNIPNRVMDLSYLSYYLSIYFRFKEKYNRVMDHLSTSKNSNEKESKIGETNVGNKMLQVSNNLKFIDY